MNRPPGPNSTRKAVRASPPHALLGPGETRLEPGDAILVYTDGVTEARNTDDQFYNEKRLEDYLADHASEPVEQLVNCLHQSVQEFALGAPQADDITALALRYNG